MYLLFDIGATNIRLGFSKDGVGISNVERVKTPEKFEDFVPLLQNYWEETKGHSLKLIAGGSTGVIDEGNNVILGCRNLPGWVEKPFGETLNKLLGARVYLKNDADLAGLGEAVYGAGKKNSIVAYLTVSTGVGGARIVNRKIDANAYGFEPGYQIIDVDSSVDRKFLNSKSRYGNNYGYLQRLISGRDIRERFGKSPENINDEKIWKEITMYLSAGLANIVSFWSPEVIVLGGGVMQSQKMKLDEINSYLKEMLRMPPKIPEIKKAELGDLGGLHGALAYLNQLDKH